MAQTTKITRRAVLTGGVSLAATPLIGINPTLAALKNEPSLKTLAAEKSIEISSAFHGQNDRELRALLAYHCDVITPENALKAANITPAGLADAQTQSMDDISNFCWRERLDIHGHALFWHQSLPSWLDLSNWADLTREMRRYVRFVTKRYPTIKSWDVINEPMADGNEPYRDQKQLALYGDEFVKFLFRYAARMAPNAKLVVNDYNLACGPDFCSAKRDRLLSFLDRMAQSEVRIDAVGLQGHLNSRWAVNQTILAEFLRELADRGYEIYISELDVNDVDLPLDISTRDEIIATSYRDFLDVALAEPAVKRLGFWGLSDRYHWIVQGYAHVQRQTGTPRPALFDQELRPKPAFYAVADAIGRATRR